MRQPGQPILKSRASTVQARQPGIAPEERAIPRVRRQNTATRGPPAVVGNAARSRGSGYTNPFRTAHTAACVRSVTPTLRSTCWTCSLTVS